MTTAITAGEVPACPGFDALPRVPRLRLPRLTCDAHHHIFGPYADYPLQRERSYAPGSSGWPLSYHNVNLANMGDDHGTDLRRY
jgi:hypothetical protein